MSPSFFGENEIICPAQLTTIVCSICGGTEFRDNAVLWPELIAEWQLSPSEVAYIDRQQGCSCTNCGANLRIVALANAILSFANTDLCLRDAASAGVFDEFRILDCNEAGAISATLAMSPYYVRADYPEHDMRRLSFDDSSFDLVFHSDTLEHIEHPVAALQECRRVLKPDGRLCFTVPIVVGRMTRGRVGLSPSYHGDPQEIRPDFVVHTEFGADAWTMLFEAGFSNMSFTQVEYPCALAISAWDSERKASKIVMAGAAEDLTASPSIYDQDGLRSIHNHEFMDDPTFQAAYARGVQAAGADYHWHWRVHVGLWAASAASKLPGDYVEFGVNRGFLSSAIMQMLDWDSTGRTFYLLDTFAGIDERFVSAEDKAIGVLERGRQDLASGFYTTNEQDVRANFSEWTNVRIIAGAVPETLPQIPSHLFAFVHIDMNCAPPEVAAAEFVWPRLIPGGMILLDDYAYAGYRSQKLAMDKFAAAKGVSILSLPTGQGLIIKPRGELRIG